MGRDEACYNPERIAQKMGRCDDEVWGLILFLLRKIERLDTHIITLENQNHVLEVRVGDLDAQRGAITKWVLRRGPLREDLSEEGYYAPVPQTPTLMECVGFRAHDV